MCSRLLARSRCASRAASLRSYRRSPSPSSCLRIVSPIAVSSCSCCSSRASIDERPHGLDVPGGGGGELGEPLVGHPWPAWRARRRGTARGAASRAARAGRRRATAATATSGTARRAGSSAARGRSAFDRLTITMYSKWLSPASRCSWVSSAAGRRMMTPIRLSQACASMPSSQRGAGLLRGRSRCVHLLTSSTSAAVPPPRRAPRPRIRRPAAAPVREADQAGRAVDRHRRPRADAVGGAGHAHDRRDPVLAGDDGAVRVGAAHLHHQRAGGEEQRGPAGVGGRRDEDLAGLQPRADRVEDDAGRRGDRAGRRRACRPARLVRGVGHGRAPRARCRRRAARAGTCRRRSSRAYSCPAGGDGGPLVGPAERRARLAAGRGRRRRRRRRAGRARPARRRPRRSRPGPARSGARGGPWAPRAARPAPARGRARSRRPARATGSAAGPARRRRATAGLGRRGARRRTGRPAPAPTRGRRAAGSWRARRARARARSDQRGMPRSISATARWP